MSHPHGHPGAVGLVPVSRCPWARGSLLGMAQGLCVLHFAIFLLHSPSPPLLCLWPCPFLPSARAFGSLGCAQHHPWCLLPLPGCQGLVLCQCQGGQHGAPTHSKPPLPSSLLWAAEGQQIIIPCCSSLMCVSISYNYVAILIYLFILKLQQQKQARGHGQDGCPGCCRKVWAFNNPSHHEDLKNKSLLSPMQSRVSGNGSSCQSASHCREL